MNGLEESWRASKKSDILHPPRAKVEQNPKASLVCVYESPKSPNNLMFEDMERLII